MGVTTTQTNKPFNPRGNDQSPKGFNRAKLYSGKALDFDGVNDFVSTPNISVQSTNVWTYTGNINFSSALGYWIDARTSDTGYAIYFDNGSRKIILYSTSGITFDFVFDFSRWYNISITSNGTTATLYVDGVLVDSLSYSYSASSTGNLFIGQRHDGGNYLDGQISGVKVFNTALTAAQVADLYNNPEKIVPTGVADSALKLWLPMQEGAGTTAYDGSGNGNHGTIAGATYTHGIGAPVAQTAVIDWNKQSYFEGSTGNDGYNNLSFPNWNTQTAVTMYAEFVWQGGASPQQILDWGGNSGFRIRLDSNDNLELLNTGGTNVLSSSTSPALNAFNRVAVKGDSNGLKIFFNGTKVASNSTALNVSQSGAYFYIGRFSSVAGEYFKGVIPEAKVWTTALTDAQLESLTAGTTNPEDYTSGALAHWTGASEYQDQVGSYDLTAIGSPVRFLAPQGLTTGRDIFNALFENVRKQGALNLDGNSWAEVHDNGSLDFGTGSFSLEAWVRVKYVSAGSAFNTILTLGGDVGSDTGLAITASLEIVFIYDGNSTSIPASTLGDWVHIVGTYNETNATFYINSSQVDQDARTAANITNTLVKQIGRDENNSRYYSDQIAQPRIYNRALTAEEVQRNYNAGKNTYTN